MELQLGLALPTNPTRGFDLNSCFYDGHKEAVPCSDLVTDTTYCKKSGLDQSFELCSAFRQTLPLLLWNNQPDDDDDDDDDDSKDRDHSAIFPNRNDEEENGLVGWPPIRTKRKRHYMQKRGVRSVAVEENRRPKTENGSVVNNREWGSNSQYVKVKMEGVGIARKVDLGLYDSFTSLRATLMNMFGEKDFNRYRLTYLDMEGDWLLAEDVAWSNFIRTVQRIKLEKKDG